MSSLNLNRACSTNANGSPGLPSSAGSENSYWLTIGRIRWRRTKRSLSLGWTSGALIAPESSALLAGPMAVTREVVARLLLAVPVRLRLVAHSQEIAGQPDGDAGA